MAMLYKKRVIKRPEKLWWGYDLFSLINALLIVWLHINATKVISKIYEWKVQKLCLFFTCILPDYIAHDIPKEFWKNIHFENMTPGFLLRCQNSLRWEISLICHWNIDSWMQKMFFVYVMVPKNDQNII